MRVRAQFPLQLHRMNTPEIFRPKDDAEIDRLVAAYPLALVISAARGQVQASPLPLVLQRRASGEATLIGHFSRFNRQLELVREEPRALIAFSGAQGYISSSWLRERKYAPTWNYEAVHFEVEITLEDEPGAAQRALEILLQQVDAPYPNPWRLEEMGARFEKLAAAIVPFRARVLGTQAQFKLGQGDPQDLLDDALGALQRYGQTNLANAMRRIHASDAGGTTAI